MQKSRQIEAIYPLSPMQQGMLFHTIYAPNSGVYFQQVKCTFEGELDTAALRQAWERVLDRHAILRTAFVWEHRKQPLQVVHPHVPLPWVEEDWRGASPSDQKERLEAYLEHDRESGFVLTKAPLMRCALLRMGDDVHEFIWSYHHILLDGWSLASLLKEVFAYYVAFQKHELLELPRPKPYQDYIAWLKHQNLDDAESFWRNSLRGFTVPTPLALARAQSDSNGDGQVNGELNVELSPELTAALNALASQHKLTVNTLVQGGWALLLSRYSGEREVVYGATVSGRPAELAGIETMIGLFINTLPVRVRVSGDELLTDWLKEIQAHQVEAREFEFSPLVQVQGWSEVPRKLPLFESLYVFENYLVDGVAVDDFGNLRVRDIRAIAKTNYPLTLIVYHGQSLLLKLFYDCSRFDSTVASRMLDHLRTVLESMVAAPHSRISELNLLTSAEREQLTAQLDYATADYSHTCIARLFESQVEKTPDATAIVFEGATLTYAELNSRANQLAHYLRSLGVGPEVVVGVCLPRSIEVNVALLGILKAGGAYLPLDPTYPSQRLSFMVSDSKMKVLLTETGLWDNEEAVHVVHLDKARNDVAKEKTDNLRSEVSGENLAYVIYTSGSTGTPKAVAMPHRPLINLVTFQTERSKTSLRTLQFSSLSFDALFHETFSTWCTGGTVVLVREETRRDARDLWRILVEERVERLFLPFVALNHLAEVVATENQVPPSLKQVQTAGEQLKITGSIRTMFERLGECTLDNHYGPSETHVATAFLLDGAPCDWPELPPIGRAITNSQIYVLDDRMQLVPVGVTGELYIGGDCVARCYLGRADATAEKFVPDPFSRDAGARLYRTGDVTRWREDGEVEFLGRVDHQVKVRGFRVELGEIESALEAHESVRDVVVVAREDHRGYKRLVAYVVVSDSGVVPQLRAHLGQLLPEYMLPSSYVVMDRLPVTTNGKVDRKALPAPDDARPDLAQTYVAARTATEELIAGVWEEVLGIARVGIDDDFFELGGHSLLAMQVISRLRDAFKLELPLRLLFSKPTIRVLAKDIEDEFQTGRALEAPPIEILSREENLPLSFAQQRLWFLDQLEPGNPFYNLGGVVRLSGKLHLPALKKSLDEVLRRHEVLRTTFEGSGEDVRQVITAAANLSLPVVDLQALQSDTRETEIRRLAVAEAQMPFNLSRGLLLRTTLLRLSEEDHVVLLTMHHIVSDEWSIGVLIQEIGVLYEAFSHGKPALLPELKIQYADYAGWQQRWLSPQITETLLTYWNKQLAGAPLVLDLPADRTRPPVQTYQGATYEFDLGADLTGRIKALSRQQGATLFMTLVAGFQALLYRYTGQDDFVIGTPVANRSRQDVEPLIGFFVNLLVLRSELNSELTFVDHLRRVRETALDAYAHQDLPFEKLVEELQPERDLSRSPVFQVLFTMQNAPTGMLSPDLAGVELSVMNIERGISRYDLGVTAVEMNDTLRMEFEYNTQLFTVSRMMRMAEHYVKLLESIVAEPQQRLAQLELMREEERCVLLTEWNQTETSYSFEACVYELVEHQAEIRPNALALTYHDSQLTFGELNQRANRLAHYLRQLGVGPEVMVGICVERSLDWVVALLAIWKAGGAYVALDPSYPAERLSYMLQDSSVPVLITQERLKQMLESSNEAHLVCLDTDRERFATESDLNPEPLAHAGNLAYITYTSGSTGRPKAVMTTHGSLLNLVFWQRRAAEITSEDRSPQFAQMGFDASVWELWPYLTAGASVHLADDETRLSPGRLREWFVDKQITIGWLPPVLAETVLDNNWPEPLRLRMLITGSDKARRHPPSSLPFVYVNSYGPTEATVLVTWGVVPLKPRSDSAPLIGRPIDNTQIYMLDRQLRPVPIGIPGELCIGGISLGRGYLNHPDLTAEKFVPDAFGPVHGMRLYRTGDLARYNEDGNIEFLGRIDDQVKVRGFRIELGEIETVLAEHPDVRTALVLANEDASNDKRLIAYVVPSNGGGNHSYELTSRLAEFTRQKLPAYMVPSAFVVLKEMPLSPNGKLNRRLLPVPEESGLITSDTYVQPRTHTEQRLAGIFETVLKVERVGVHDNFFELGGHSLLATQVVSQIREQLNVELSLRSFFASPAVADIAELIQPQPVAQNGARRPQIKPISRVRHLPLSFAQQGLWLTDRLEPGTTAYNIPLGLRFTGALNVEVLRQTLTEVARRHEVLRTTFAEIAGEPQQIVAPPSELSLPLLDLSELEVAEQEDEVERHLQQAAQQQFDLSRGPLMKTEMLKLAEDEHVLYLTLHHIIADGWSMGVLVNEVGALYEAFAEGRESPLAELPIQYADYAIWQRQWLQGEVLEGLLNYWHEQLAGAPLLELPNDYSRADEQPTGSQSQIFELSPELTAALNELTRREGVTMFMTLLACWQLLLARYTGQDDIVIGSPIANRNRAEVEGLVGLFVNILVMRTQVFGEMTFLELLARVREVCLGAYAHQDLPFEWLVEQLRPERELSRPPLVQVLFQLQNMPYEELKLPGLKLTALPTAFGAAKVDLTLSMGETEGKLFGEFIYSENLSRDTILRMERQWRLLLQSVVEDPDSPVATLEMGTEEESVELIDSFNEQLEV